MVAAVHFLVYLQESSHVKRKGKEKTTLAACIKERSPERQGPTTQTKRKRWHRSLHQQVGLHHGKKERSMLAFRPRALRKEPPIDSHQ
eukprot:scaffold31032_cov19-Tisochrysis_lutea.AAC.1